MSKQKIQKITVKEKATNSYAQNISKNHKKDARVNCLSETVRVIEIETLDLEIIAYLSFVYINFNNKNDERRKEKDKQLIAQINRKKVEIDRELNEDSEKYKIIKR